jgi:hypothetical protein
MDLILEQAIHFHKFEVHLVYSDSSAVVNKIGSMVGTLHIPTKIVNNCFGNGTSLLSRNLHLALISGNPFHAMNETTVNYF